MDLPPAYSLDTSSEKEDEMGPGISGEERMGHGETWTREQRVPAQWSNHSWNNQTGGRMSQSWESCSCSRLAWRLQVKNSSCWWSAKMRPHFFLIQGCTGQRGHSCNIDRPGYLQGGSLAHCEGLYRCCLFNPSQRDGIAGTTCPVPCFMFLVFCFSNLCLDCILWCHGPQQDLLYYSIVAEHGNWTRLCRISWNYWGLNKGNKTL